MNELQKLAKDYTIFIVDDEKSITSLLKELLGFFFKKVETTNDPFEALKRCQEEDFDLLLVDITMPKMNGLELIKHLKTLKPNQHIVILSAHNTPEFIIEAINLDVDNYLIKPIEQDRLFHTLQKILHQIEMEKVNKAYHQKLEKEIEQVKAQLLQAYLHDPITHLPNRTALMDKIQKESPKALIMADIDNFSIYNILYGYKMADKLLQQIASYLLKRYADLHCIGGDVFALTTNEDPKKLAQQIHQDILEFSTSLEDFPISLTATVAYSTNPPLLQTASVALQHLKKLGKNRVGGYESTIDTTLARKIHTYLPLLKTSVKNKSLFPLFQPIADREGKIAYYETLVRIQDAHGNIHPACEFIEVAQVSGLIHNITEIIVEKAFEIASRLQKHLSINISFQDLEDENFLPFITRILDKYKLPPSLITFEILEDSVNTTSSKAFMRIRKLHQLGFFIAIDDFGAKNSNFERIHNLSPHYIKIDGKYIKDIDTNKKSYEITKAITNFAKSIGAKVVAEFVSSASIAKIVKELGVDYMQGWYFGKPAPLEELKTAPSPQ